MALLPATIFQPTLPPLILLIPPSSPFQWTLRTILLLWTISTFPLLLILIPCSVILPAPLKPLPIHPHNLPPYTSHLTAVFRGYFVYMMGGLIWGVTSTGCAPENGEGMIRNSSWLIKCFVEFTAWVIGDSGYFRKSEFIRSCSTCCNDDGETSQPVSVFCPKSREGRGRQRQKKSSVSSEKSSSHGLDTNQEKEKTDSSHLDNNSSSISNSLILKRSQAKLVISEEEMRTFPLEQCHGVLDAELLDRRSVTGFWLKNEYIVDACLNQAQSSSSTDSRRVFLFLAGGGYVTGFPLIHPFIFSLLRSLPPSPRLRKQSSSITQESDIQPVIQPRDNLPQYAVLAPHVRKSLSIDRAFPVPLLDALAGYNHLIEIGYKPEEIIVIGDSAGGGLTWSLVAYLAALSEIDTGNEDIRMGVPGGIALISPWLSLPPTASSPYPDLIDEPQLLNAARCYLARFPIVKHRPDPFSSDFHLWLTMIDMRLDTFSEGVKRVLPIRRLLRKKNCKKLNSNIDTEKELLRPDGNFITPVRHVDWLRKPIFEHLTSHHPLVSPSSDLSSPFVQHTFKLLQQNRTKLFMHLGTAEWFYQPAVSFFNSAQDQGVTAVLVEEKGGLHIESCIMPSELGGMGGRFLKSLREWVLCD